MKPPRDRSELVTCTDCGEEVLPAGMGVHRARSKRHAGLRGTGR